MRLLLESLLKLSRGNNDDWRTGKRSRTAYHVRLVTVGKLVANAGAEVVSFVRFEVGEGIEVEQVDFAAEVAAQLNG